MHPFDGPDPVARKPKAGASKGTPQRCSCNSPGAGAPASPLEVPSGRLGMRSPGISALATRRVIGGQRRQPRRKPRGAPHGPRP